MDGYPLMTENTRRYTDEEFARVLHTALQLQDRDTSGWSGGHGLTLEQMKEAAREVGIDPALVDRAVALLPRKATSWERLVGGPTRYRLSHSAPVPPDPDAVVQVVDRIRAELGVAGRLSSELDGVTWETEGELSQLHVALFPSATGTEVRVAVNRDPAFILTWFLSLAGGLVAAGVTGGIIDPTAAEGTLIMGSGVGGGLVLARLLWRRSTRIIRHRAERLMALITRGLEQRDS